MCKITCRDWQILCALTARPIAKIGESRIHGKSVPTIDAMRTTLVRLPAGVQSSADVKKFACI